MRLKYIFPVLAALLLNVLSTSAQTVDKSDTFTFVGGRVLNLTQQPGGTITAWDGVLNAYPEDMGAVNFTGPFPSLYVPFQLGQVQGSAGYQAGFTGYLNNGDLDPCDPMTAGVKTFTQGDGTHDGDLYSQSFATVCPYFTGEYGDYDNSNNRLEGWSVVANYKVHVYTTFYHGSRRMHIFIELLGGTGTMTDSLLN